jgi:chromosome segregation ATPase
LTQALRSPYSVCMTMSEATKMEPSIESDLSLLERKLATLVAHTRALRAANESLRSDLAAAHEKNRTLSERVAAASQRLDALLARLPETTE